LQLGLGALKHSARRILNRLSRYRFAR